MLECIEFTNNHLSSVDFKFKNEYNQLYDLTNNNIIICENCKIKNFLSTEIFSVLDNKQIMEDGHSYYFEEEDKYNTEVIYRNTTIFNISKDQQFILTIDKPFVLLMEDKKDLWFATCNKDNEIEIIPFTAYIGHQEVWEKGKIDLYKEVLACRYGV